MIVMVYGRDATNLVERLSEVVNVRDVLVAHNQDEGDAMFAERGEEINCIVWLENAKAALAPNVLQIVSTRQMQEYFLGECVPTTQPLSDEAILNLLCTML